MPELGQLRSLVARSLRASRGTTAVAALSLGVAIALNTAMFGAIDQLSHPPRPFRDADRLVAIDIRASGPRDHLMSRGTAAVLARSAPSLSAVATSEALLAPTLGVDGHLSAVSAQRVSPNYFAVVALSPLAGRTFRDEDAGSRVAVVSERRWRRELGGRPLAEVRVTIDDSGYAVIGVIPTAGALALGADAWIVDAPTEPGDVYVSMMARLKGETSPAIATREIQSIVGRLQPGDGRGARAPVVRVASAGAGPSPIQDYHVALSGAALCVLLIACANIATLLLARGVSRRREMAVRTALGAARARLVGQLLTEYAVIAVLGAVFGLVLAAGGIQLAADAMPPSMRMAGLAPQLNWRVWSFGFGVCSVAVFAFGVWPAIRTTDVSLTDALKDGAVTSTGRVARSHGVLVATEFALAILLVTASSLLARTVYRLATFDMGYAMDGLVTTQVVPADLMARMNRARRAGDSAAVVAMRAQAGDATRNALETIASANGIQAVTAFAGRRIADGRVTTPGGDGEAAQTQYQLVTADFFRVFAIPIVRGRAFTASDVAGGSRAIVDVRLAAQLWPNTDPIGQTIRLGGAGSMAPTAIVVGVCRSAYFKLPTDLDVDAPALVAVLTDSSDRIPGAFLVARGTVATEAAAAQVTRQLSGHMPIAVSTGVTAWAAPFRDVLDRQEFLGAIFVAFGAIGLALAAIGLYGTVSYIVHERQREFAVRLALGADARHVLSIVLRSAATMVLAGAGIGAALAMWASRFLDSLLYGVFQIDAPALIGAELVLFAVAAAAAYVPARRATRASPLDALRSS